MHISWIIILYRFDPPNTWVLGEIDRETKQAINDGFLIGRFIPINKNHTRLLFRNYDVFFNKLFKYIPFWSDINFLESWRIFDEDNSIIVGQSIRVDLLGADIMHKPRGEDMNIPLLYKWWGEAIKNDKGDIWFKSWKCDNDKKTKTGS